MRLDPCPTLALACALVVALALGACGPRGPATIDEQASRQYHAALAQKARGDEEGFRKTLADIASSSPNSRAGRRARQVLAPAPRSTGGFAKLLLYSLRSTANLLRLGAMTH